MKPENSSHRCTRLLEYTFCCLLTQVTHTDAFKSMSFFEEKKLDLRAMGFCGADDSCSPEHLQLLSAHYSWVEWGVLFRPDLEGTPRYASKEWVQSLVDVNKKSGEIMRLAAHLCQSRCQQVLEGDASFIKELSGMGFARVCWFTTI